MVIMSAGVRAAAGEVFVSPRCEAQAGYEKNRMLEPGSGDGTALLQANPGLDLILFGDRTEISLSLDYRHTQYAESDCEARDESSAFVKWRYIGGPDEFGAGIGGGLYRDEALPADDCTYWQARPYIIRTLDHLPAELSLNGCLRQNFYDVSVYTSAADRVDSRIDVRPGLRWHLSERLTAWSEIYAEKNASDAPEAEYSGYGGAMGCEYRPTKRLSLGAWGGLGTRSYEADVDGEDRRDTPFPAGIWATYRLHPWLELFASAYWESYASTSYENDYSWWRAGGGVRCVFEEEIHPR